MVSFNASAGQTKMSGSQDQTSGLTSTTHITESSDPALHCAFQSQAELRTASSTRYPEDIQQVVVLGDGQDNARIIGAEIFVTEKIFSMMPEDEKLLWHLHNAEIDRGLLSSPATRQVANTYGRVFRSLQTTSDNALPPVLSQLLTSSSDPGLEKRRVKFAEDDVKPIKGTQGSEEGKEELTTPGKEWGKPSEVISPYSLETTDGTEDIYLNDAVNRPVVHHKSSHLPALTERMPDDGRYLSETLSTRF